MKKYLLVTAASLVVLSAAGCVGVGKGKDPPPAPALVITKGGRDSITEGPVRAGPFCFERGQQFASASSGKGSNRAMRPAAPAVAESFWAFGCPVHRRQRNGRLGVTAGQAEKAGSVARAP